MAALRFATTRLQDMQPLAVAGQTTIEAWRTLHTLLLRELSPAHAALLSEPVPNPARGEVDWYAEGDGPATPLQSLGEPERGAAQARLDELIADIQALAARIGSSRADSDRFLAEMLGLALRLPGPEHVHVRGGQPLLAAWGHVPSSDRGGGLVLTGAVAPVTAAMAILPPPPSPYGRAPLPRTWLWGVLAASLLLPLLALFLLVRDPFGWFSPEVAACRLQPGQLDLARGMQDEAAREGVLRAELARLAADAGQRRLRCQPPPTPPPPPTPRPPPTPPPPAPPPPAPPPSEDANRAQRQGGQRGKLQIILAWDDRNDLDLRIVCPNGSDINYIRRRNCGGTLDVDANGDVNALSTTPVENVFFEDPQPGRYRVIVDPYGMRVRPESPYRVTIRREGQADEVHNGVATNGRRNQLVVEVTVPPRTSETNQGPGQGPNQAPNQPPNQRPPGQTPPNPGPRP